MRRKKLIGGLTLAVGIMMISIGMVVQNEDKYATITRSSFEQFDIKNMAASANMIVTKEKVVEEKTPAIEEINMEIAPSKLLRQEVYEGMTLEEVAEKLNRSLKNDIAGKGMTIASKSIELGVDPFVATAIIMHETGCGQSSCSNIARTCYNFGGQKGSGCGAYQRYNSIDEGLEGMINNLYRNYYSKGLTTVETIGPRYAESGEWIGKINWYVGKIKNA